MNKIFIIGNLTKDPVYNSESEVCKMTVAVNRQGKDGEKETEYFDVAVFKASGVACSRFLTKGNKVAVVGTLKTSKYTTKDGNQGVNLSIAASDVEFLTPKTEADKPTEAKTAPKKRTKLVEVEVDDDSNPF